MSPEKLLLYKSIVQFLKKDINGGVSSSEISESLEIAKQCLESAFNFPADDPDSVPDLESLFYSAQLSTCSSTEPTERAKSMAENLKNQGNQCMKNSKFEEAVACYSKAIELWGTNAIYHCNRAAAYSRLSKQTEAIADCLTALKIDPTYAKAYGRMGIAHSSLGDYAKAAECYRKGLELEPSNEICKSNLVLAEEHLKEAEASPSRTANGAGGFDLSSFLNNPMIGGLASQLMQNPNAQNLISGMMRNAFGQEGGANDSENATANMTDHSPNMTNAAAGGGADMNHLLHLGQQLAQQLHTANPQLVDQLRQSFHNNSTNSSTQDEQPHAGSS